MRRWVCFRDRDEGVAGRLTRLFLNFKEAGQRIRRDAARWW
jgi:hypothetical protein